MTDESKAEKLEEKVEIHTLISVKRRGKVKEPLPGIPNFYDDSVASELSNPKMGVYVEYQPSKHHRDEGTFILTGEPDMQGVYHILSSRGYTFKSKVMARKFKEEVTAGGTEIK